MDVVEFHLTYFCMRYEVRTTCTIESKYSYWKGHNCNQIEGYVDRYTPNGYRSKQGLSEIGKSDRNLIVDISFMFLNIGYNGKRVSEEW